MHKKMTVVLKFEGNTVAKETYKLVLQTVDQMVHVASMNKEVAQKLRLDLKEYLARCENMLALHSQAMV